MRGESPAVEGVPVGDMTYNDSPGAQDFLSRRDRCRRIDGRAVRTPFKAARDVTGAAYRRRVQRNGARTQKKGVIAEVRNEPLMHGRGLCAGLKEKPCRGVRQIPP